MQGVARAIRRSRFVALWVSNHFVDSPWCRAEYLDALWVEKKYGIPRALVVCEAYDFVLKPLLLAVELEDTRAEAASAYRDLCSSLQRGVFAHEAPVYLASSKQLSRRAKTWRLRSRTTELSCMTPMTRIKTRRRITSEGLD